MGIGYQCIGDLRKYHSKEAIDNSNFDEDFNETYKEDGRHPNHRKCCWQFANEVKTGDIVFAKNGKHRLLGYGIVESDYFYNKDNMCYDGKYWYCYPHIRKVKWHPFEDKNEKFTDIYLDMKTLIEVKDANANEELCKICGISN